jgi:hypothetical protein
MSMDLPISKILDVIKDPDLKIKISQLVSENLQLKEENFALKRKLEKQEELKEIDSSLIHENNHYYLKKDEAKSEPYCTNCWDTDKKLILLHKGFLSDGQQHYDCPSCKTHTKTGNYTPAPAPDWEINY